MLNRSLVPFCIYGGLGLPALVIAYIYILRNCILTIYHELILRTT
nr:MAG TPA: hypothetical protein [Caudoviricetes sp.]